MKIKVLSMLVVLGLFLSACGGAKATEPAAATEAAVSGGTVTLIIPEEPALLNYFASDAAIVRQAAEATSMTGLVTIDVNGDFVPVLATELPIARKWRSFKRLPNSHMEAQAEFEMVRWRAAHFRRYQIYMGSAFKPEFGRAGWRGWF